MNKREEVHNQIISLLKNLTDTQLLNAIDLHDSWHPGKHYVTDVVNYNGNLYRCLQDHTSQNDWTPDTAPSLWAKYLFQTRKLYPNGNSQKARILITRETRQLITVQRGYLMYITMFGNRAYMDGRR